MNISQKEAWIMLKKAVDKYSHATGAEVAVITKYYPITALSENYLPQEDVKSETAVYGHGSLTNEVKYALDPKKIDWSNQGVRNSTEEFSFFPDHDKPKYPLSSSYCTLKLETDFHPKPEPNKTNNSSDINNDDSLIPSMPTLKTGKRNPKKTKYGDGDFELDENLLFGEEELSQDSDEDESSESNDEVYNAPTSHYTGLSGRRPPANGSRDQFATSLPVSINHAWGQHNDNITRFRDNQGPRPPTYNQPISGGRSNARTIEAEQTPHLDAIMASMQALARSVTDDTALVFGERPRPRFYNESTARNAH